MAPQRAMQRVMNIFFIQVSLKGLEVPLAVGVVEVELGEGRVAVEKS